MIRAAAHRASAGDKVSVPQRHDQYADHGASLKYHRFPKALRLTAGLRSERADEVDDVPNVVARERLAPGRHARPSNAIGDPIEKLRVGVTCGHMHAEIR